MKSATTTLVLLLAAASHLAAAEIRLRSQCQSRGALVTLGEVAEIFAAKEHEAEALADVELFPAPAATRQRFLSLRELQDLLLLRGVKLAEHRFSGSNQVAIAGGDGPVAKIERPQPTEQPRPVSDADRKRASRCLTEVIVQYLKRQPDAAVDASWRVSVELTSEQARAVSQPDCAVSVTGGAPPWTGVQRFEVTILTADQPQSFPLEVEVSAAPAMVVAVHSLPRGTVIQAADVALQSGPTTGDAAEAFASVDEVIGKETASAIPLGKVLQRKLLKAPLMVRRGDVVSVCARNAGICVRTTARARDDGALGDLIAVESTLDRASYFARVSGVREAEVSGNSAAAGTTIAARPTRPVRK